MRQLELLVVLIASVLPANTFGRRSTRSAPPLISGGTLPMVGSSRLTCQKEVSAGWPWYEADGATQKRWGGKRWRFSCVQHRPARFGRPGSCRDHGPYRTTIFHPAGAAPCCACGEAIAEEGLGRLMATPSVQQVWLLAATRSLPPILLS
jgi:hypothetical protein